MQALELKIPPPVVALLVAAAMWGTSAITPTVDIPLPARITVAVLLAVAGGVFSIAGIIAFRAADTTVNPMKPDATRALVRNGVYRLTRNPMYLGLLFVLVAWAVFLSSPWTLLWPAGFVLYTNRFQIAPEERTLSTKFGADYSNYRSAVRRWL
jgi:protein-S-isoprenylcysteine O-methyltransferase Ste14